MADNYLENKMEEHQRGAARKAAPRFVSGSRAGHLDLPLPRLRVVIVGYDETAADIARLLVKTGMQVAIIMTSDEYDAATTLDGSARIYRVADYTDSTLRPILCERLRDWKGLDMIIDVCADDIARLSALLLDVRSDYPIPLTSTPLAVTFGATARQHDGIATLHLERTDSAPLLTALFTSAAVRSLCSGLHSS